MKFVFALLFLSCAAVPARGRGACVTSCGMSAEISHCEELRAAELATVAAYALKVPEVESVRAACEPLKGWRVVIHVREPRDIVCGPVSWQVHGFGWAFCASGYTHERDRIIEVPDEHWTRNALSHEIGHVVVGIGHCKWHERGVKEAIRLVTGEEDPSQSDC